MNADGELAGEVDYTYYDLDPEWLRSLLVCFPPLRDLLAGRQTKKGADNG